MSIDEVKIHIGVTAVVGESTIVSADGTIDAKGLVFVNKDIGGPINIVNPFSIVSFFVSYFFAGVFDDDGVGLDVFGGK